MSFKSVVVTIGTTDTDVFTCPATLDGAVVLGIANVSASSATYTVKFYKQSTGTTTTIASTVAIAARTPTKYPHPISMEAGDVLIMSASAGSAIVAQATATVSTATPAAVGFTPKGAHSDVATYDRNDIVSKDGNSYISIQDDNLGNDPATETAWWMLLAEKGEPGAGIGDMIAANNGSDFEDPDEVLDNLGGTTVGVAVFKAADEAAARAAIGAGGGDVSGPGSSTDNGVPRFDSTDGKTLQASPNVVINDSGYLGVGQTSPVSLLHVGDGSTDVSGNSMVLLNNTYTGTSSRHELSINSTFTPGANALGWGVADCRISITGSRPIDHVNCWQALPTHNTSNTTSSIAGYTVTPTVAGGTVNALYGLYVSGGSGAGTVDTYIPIFIEDQAIGSSNYAIRSQSSAESLFNGDIGVNRTNGEFAIKNGSNVKLGRWFHDATNMTFRSVPNGSFFLGQNDTNRVELTSDRIRPVTDNALNCGDSSHKWVAVYAVNGTIQTSDVRTKNVLGPAPGLDFINQIEPIAFTRKDDPANTLRYGISAQQVASVDDGGPVVVYDAETDKYGAHYDALFAPLINAVKELSRRVGELEKARNPVLSHSLGSHNVSSATTTYRDQS